jgi:hypothetical protein
MSKSTYFQKRAFFGALLILLFAGSSGCVYGTRKLLPAVSKAPEDASGSSSIAGGDQILPSDPAPTPVPAETTPPPPPPPPAPTPPPPPPPVVSGCTDDSGCTNNEKCDTSSHQCVGCLTNTDCSSGQTCDPQQHQCVTPWVPPYTPEPGYCSSDQECVNAHGAGWTCSDDRLCQAPAPAQPPSQKLTLGEQDEISPIGGGGGGGPWAINCPEGQVIVGFSLRAGDVLDAFDSLYCEPVNQLGAGSTQIVPTSPLGGPGGGAPQYLPHPAPYNNVVSGFQVKMTSYNGFWVVGTLKPYTKPVDQLSGVVDSGEINVGGIQYGKDDPNQHWVDLKCPDGFLATGVSAFDGSYVDALGLNCRKVYPAGQAPAAHPTADLGLTDLYEFGPRVGVTGGPHGLQFRQMCPPGQVIVSASLSSGNIIDQFVKFKCAILGDVVKRTVFPWWTPVHAGGTGGTESELMAPAGYAFYGWSNSIGQDEGTCGPDNDILSKLVFHTAPIIEPNGISHSNVFELGPLGLGSATSIDNDCPVGYALVGVKGKSGGVCLDNLGGICQRITH